MPTLPIDLFTQNLPNLQSLIKELVEIESPSTDKAAVDRFGRRLILELQALGGVVEVITQQSTGDQLISRWGKGPGGILLLYHMDTVFDLGTLARQPFHASDDKLFGPGISDMKSSIAMLMIILRLFHQHSLSPDYPITALFTADEETGSLTSRQLIETEARQAAIAFCMEPALSNGAIKTARKGTGDIEIQAKGVAAHAGIDHAQGRNAIEELAYHILDAQKLTDYRRGTTVNVGVIAGGTRGNVVPDEAHALIDFRVTDLAEINRLEQWVETLSPTLEGTQISATLTLNRPPMPRDATMAHTYQKAQSIAREIGLELTEGSTGGGSDANFVASLGIPVLDGLGAVGDGAHSDHEFVHIASLAERSALLAALLLNW